MNHPVLLLAALLVGGALPAAAQTTAQATTLTPAAGRISDAAIQADQQAYEALQGRIKGLNDGGRPVRDYHLSKAQCWLDVSFHEYTRNDRGPFPQAALSESEKLIAGMEAKAANLPSDTPLVGEAVLLRPDLWARAAALKGAAGFACAQQRLACAEVELVHAGNEHAQQQWRHAKPYVQIAEDLLGEAESLAAGCAPATPVAVAVVPAPVPAEPPPAPAPVQAPVLVPRAVAAPPVQEVALAAQVVFNFDRHAEKDMRPHSLKQLQALVARLRSEGLVVSAIRLSGHADRLNRTGQADYNQRLSERRVATVRDTLVRLGVDAALISTEAQGDGQQVLGCEERFKSRADLQECLLPNRRVDVSISASRAR